MKLLLVLTVTLAFALAAEFDMEEEPIDDLQAAASMELQKSERRSPPYFPPRPWNPPSNSYYNQIPSAPPVAPAPTIPSPSVSQGGYFSSQNDPPQNTYYPSSSGNYNNPAPSNTWDNQNSWNQNQNTWNNPQNSWTQKPQTPVNNQQNNWNNQQTTTQNKPQNTGSQNSWTKPENTGSQNTWTKPQNTGSQNSWTKPENTGSQNTWTKPQNTGSQNWNNQNSNNNWNNWNQTPTSTSTTTTPVAVLKNEHIIGENGSYQYEYQIADGTHVGEIGYLQNKSDPESIVKKGFYSYTGADGKVYTVKYWADFTGYHAFGDHLPQPPPIPPAIQASIDQNAKEEAAKAEAEKNKQQQQQQGTYYPPGQEPPKPIAPQQPVQS